MRKSLKKLDFFWRNSCLMCEHVTELFAQHPLLDPYRTYIMTYKTYIQVYNTYMYAYKTYMYAYKTYIYEYKTFIYAYKTYIHAHRTRTHVSARHRCEALRIHSLTRITENYSRRKLLFTSIQLKLSVESHVKKIIN